MSAPAASCTAAQSKGDAINLILESDDLATDSRRRHRSRALPRPSERTRCPAAIPKLSDDQPAGPAPGAAAAARLSKNGKIRFSIKLTKQERSSDFVRPPGVDGSADYLTIDSFGLSRGVRLSIAP